MSDPIPCPVEDCPGDLSPDGVCDECGAAEAADAEDELAARLACPDGNCIGVADTDGHCSECGAFIGEPEEAADSDDDERLPCPDGDCIGVIGADGQCTECGAEGPGGAVDPGGDWEQDGEDDGEWDDESDNDDDSDDDDDDRVPCPDGGCIGIIEADGRCSECGQGVDPDE